MILKMSVVGEIWWSWGQAPVGESQCRRPQVLKKVQAICSGEIDSFDKPSRPVEVRTEGRGKLEWKGEKGNNKYQLQGGCSLF